MFYHFAEEQAIKIIPLFFKADRSARRLGLSASEIGLLCGVFGVIAFILGSILAGNDVAKRGLTRETLLTICACFNIPFAAYVFLAIFVPTNLVVIATAVIVEYFGYDFGFVCVILFTMQNIALGKYKMAHSAFGSGLINLGFILPSMLSGVLSNYMGYKVFFIWVLISIIPAFLFTWLVFLRKSNNFKD